MKKNKITECTRVPLVLTVSIVFHPSHTMRDAPYLLNFFLQHQIYLRQVTTTLVAAFVAGIEQI